MSASNAGGGKAAPGIDANRSGVFRAPASLNSVRELAKKAVLAWLELSLDAVSNKLQFLDACARQLKLPVHFGGNWDALADCLRDLPPAQSAGFVLHVSGAAKFAKASPEDYQTALAVFAEAAAFWKGKGKTGTPFVVLVDGAKDLPAF